MIKFLKMYGEAEGDYAKERQEWIKDITEDEIKKFIEENWIKLNNEKIKNYRQYNTVKPTEITQFKEIFNKISCKIQIHLV